MSKKERLQMIGVRVPADLMPRVAAAARRIHPQLSVAAWARGVLEQAMRDSEADLDHRAA